ncbi:Heat_shock protein 90 [Hexamita inflata]|uniref:Heat shock protein 90 n=1 Tax=Hexamita inflata TaxID=28002 RepID=A0AA86Q2P1_9EUKA|nr:Heat shock protein 90 [Hexamita inflata]CAI9914746.1 Heat shock protein 90 [Hexamita inflata]CAI9951056.1 Heat shock protein 90 [Hexamita inflata]CAI9951060.1 Heat shock protein 90 [Hexamita inflata]CAI9967408.1 Heat shock protein 90 [Hexamita inflata]
MIETFEFQAEISQLMNLIINTFYSTKEIFLRELVSNCSDACDKISFMALTNKDILGEQRELRIDVTPNADNNTLIIKDTGVGMTKADLVSCLGTIARSGAKQFMEMVQEGSDVSLIGQFGVGFYSAYLVAEKVIVVSKHSDDECYKWTSTAGGTYQIEEVDRPDMIRGTEITLQLKEDQLEYLKAERLEELIKKHSMFIGYPIYIHKVVEEEVEEKKEEKKEEEVKEGEEGKVEEASDEEKKEDGKTEKKKVKKNVTEHINAKTAIWTRDPKDVTEDEYKEFYKQINPTDWEGHLAVSHFRVDGAAQFRGILYIPKKAPFDMWETQKKKVGIKLMVKKVFITEECTDIIPEWLGFLKGVVDCDDLPLNISREMLQKNRIVNTIKKNLIKKALKLFKDLEEDKEKYEQFMKNFGKSIKLGIHEDTENREKLAKLLRFSTTKSGDKKTSFDDYITRMAEGQKNMYYITGDNMNAMKESPFLERFQKKNIEVIYFDDAIDEYMVQSLKEVDGKQLKCITKDGIDLETTEDEKKAQEEKKAKYEKLAKAMKETLGDKVENVRVSGDRLVSSPCILVTSEWGWSANMQKIMKHQALRDDSMASVMQGKKTLEINPDNTIIRSLAEKLESDAEAVYVKDITTLLYETAMIQSGFDVEDISNFAKRIYGMVKVGLGAEDEVAPAAEQAVPKLEECDNNEDIDQVD